MILIPGTMFIGIGRRGGESILPSLVYWQAVIWVLYGVVRNLRKIYIGGGVKKKHNYLQDGVVSLILQLRLFDYRKNLFCSKREDWGPKGNYRYKEPKALRTK